MTYHVTVSEIFKKTISIEADDETEAIQKASELWNSFSDELDSPPLKEVRFDVG
ncbi:MAG: hypothetical protein IJ899_17250 [Blautia sp.]|nr:hypothetical protein [Blautia sp.]